MRALLRRHWPPEGQIRLLTAALAEPDAARQAWRQWRAENDLAAADHAEVRLLAAVAGRIREIEPDLPLDPRLEGMRRYIWAVNQVTFSATRPLLTAMQDAGLGLMLLKGAARLAADPGLAKQRAARDIDVLIHPDDWWRATDVVRAEGWRNPHGGNHGLPDLTVHAIGLSGPNSRLGSEFDLHRFAIRQNQCRDHDLGLWDRAQRVPFQGVDVFCPCPTDQAIVTLSQASLFNRGPQPAHWALDIAAFVRAGQIDWDLFLREVHFRRIELFVAAPLLLLRERLQIPILDHVLDDLTRPIGKPYLVEVETRTKNYRPKTPDAIKASRFVAGARAMRLARARPLSNTGIAAQPASTSHVWWLGRDAKLAIPVPSGLPPFARLRVEVSFQAWHAGPNSHVLVMSQNVVLARIQVARASRTSGGRVRYTTVFRVPACLLAMSGGGKIRIYTDSKLRIRNLRVRFGPPATAVARLSEAVRSRLAKWLPLRRPSAEPASL